MLWDIDDLKQALKNEIIEIKGNCLGGTGLSIDTRTLQNGDIFLALRGEDGDGHTWLPLALEKKASLVIIDQVSNCPKDLNAFVVKDTFKALQILGKYRRSQVNAKICAITGSSGKTSTKEALRLICELKGPTSYSQESYNNHWGVPLSLARMPKDTEFGIFEVGMNHEGEILPLVEMIAPDISLITNIGEAHIGHMGSIDAIAREKSDIFYGANIGIVGGDSPSQVTMKYKAMKAGLKKLIRVGKSQECGINLISYTPTQQGSDVIFTDLGDSKKLSLSITGYHHALNALMAYQAAKEMGISEDLILKALKNYKAFKGRGEVHVLEWNEGTITLIDDAYNANPASMKAGLKILKDMPSTGRKIVVIGQMLELGENAHLYHANIAPQVQEAGATLAFACGAEMKDFFDALPKELQGAYVEDHKNLWPYVQNALQVGDTVYIKGSKGSKVSTIVEKIKEHSKFLSTTK